MLENREIKFEEKLILGRNVEIGYATLLDAEFGIEIGENSKIGPHCAICSKSIIGNKQGKIIIGKNCLIGAFTLIMPNVAIEDGITLPAYSYVDKNVDHSEKHREGKYLLQNNEISVVNWSYYKIVKLFRKMLGY